MFKKPTRFSPLALLATTAIVLSACAPVGIATGVGATAGIAAGKEGGIRTAVEDTRIRAEISDLWFKYKYDTFGKLNLEVNQGRVLVTGVVQNPEDRVEAIRLAWQPKGVKQVINEVRIGKSGGLTSYAKDTWIAGNIRTKMIAHENVQSINYTIEMVQGSVYLMGVAQDQAELDRVIKICKTTPGVKEVISYVKMLGEPVTGGAVSPSVSVPVENSSYNTPSEIGSGYVRTPSSAGYNDAGMVPSTYPADSVSSSVPVPLGGGSSSTIESETLPP